LAAAIPGSVVRRITKTGTTENIDDAMLLDPSGNTYTILQWVGADIDSFNTAGTPGWSGFIDIDAPTNSKTSLTTPGSNLSLTNTIITNLNGGSFPTAWAPAIYFPYDTKAYSLNTPLSGTTLSLAGTGATRIVEHYKLAWTSYALSVENGDLYLYYGFDPVTGWGIPNGTNKSLLMKNISTFKFKGAGRTIRFKICKEENIGEDLNITSCKEKVIF
jgi:hypothetical protein